MARQVNDRRIATMLNEAKSCGISVDEMGDLITDYFASNIDNSDHSADELESSDKENGDGSDFSGDESASSASVGDEPMHLSDDEDTMPEAHIDEVNVEVAKAMENAEDHLVDTIPLKEKTCHCKCSLFNKARCIEQFSQERLEAIRYSVAEMTSYEKDLLLIGVICSSINTSEQTQRQKQKPAERKLTMIRAFFYEDKRVCRDTFLYLFDISKYTLTAVKAWYSQKEFWRTTWRKTPELRGDQRSGDVHRELCSRSQHPTPWKNPWSQVT